jgi:hypothetical protein
MTAPTRRSLTFGLLCALAASLVAVFILLLVEGEGHWMLLFAAPAAAFVCGAALWRILPERTSGRSAAWGACAGALAGVVSHYLAWYLQYVGMNLCFWLTGGCTSSLGEPPANLLAAFAGAAAFTFFSLLVVGWATLPIGAVLGLVFAKKTEPRA